LWISAAGANWWVCPILAAILLIEAQIFSRRHKGAKMKVLIGKEAIAGTIVPGLSDFGPKSRLLRIAEQRQPLIQGGAPPL